MQATLQHSLLLRPAASRGSARRRSRFVAASSAGQEHTSSGAAGAAAADRASRRAALAALVASVAAYKAAPAAAGESAAQVRHTDAEWRQLLSPEAYAVLRRAGTEPRFSSPLVKEKRAGTYCCGGCGQPLFDSSAKYESGTGWPSYFDALPGAVVTEPDNSIPLMPRTAVECSRCLSHLGHVFDDGPAPTGLRYCMNGVALRFEPAAA